MLAFGLIDISQALYNRYHVEPDEKSNKVSHVAHLSGAIGGILVGIIILKNRKVESWETKLKILCMVLFGCFIGGCIFWNITADYIMAKFYFPSKDFQDYSECENPSL